MLPSDIAVLVFFSNCFFLGRRLLRYLRYLQQEEYNPARFMRWIAETKSFDRRGSLIAAVTALFCFVASQLTSAVSLAWLTYVFSALAASSLIMLAKTEPDPRKSGKIKLNMTERARATYSLAICILGFSLVLGFMLLRSRIDAAEEFYHVWVSQILFIQLAPFCLVLSVMLLKPIEAKKQRKLLNEAKQKFRNIRPYSVGITGSFGKTSTKNMLGRILEVTLGPTFFPQKGINTPMGITREIRERLSPGHKFAVIEMGAYHEGSIKRLCDLTPIDSGIVTAVSIMHLERFGGEENVYRAKSELAQAIPQAGILVCNGDNPGALRMATEFRKEQTFVYGSSSITEFNPCLLDSQSSVEGTTFRLLWNGETYSGFTKLHGKSALSNILASFTMACALGADPEYVLAAIRGLEPVSNRLEVVRIGEAIQINDAYNSNPSGFLSALEVLEELPGNRKVLMTPGMIELGTLQAVENERIAEEAGKRCTHVIVVGDVNKEALLQGLAKTSLPKENIYCIAHRDDALKKLSEFRKTGDVVLLENDLPDLYEGVESF